MGWGEYVYIGYVGRVGNKEDDPIFCKYDADGNHITISDHDRYLLYIAKKLDMNVEDLLKNGRIKENINLFIRKKYGISENIFHTNYHPRYDYVAVGIEIVDFSYDKLIDNKFALLIKILKDIFKIIDIYEEPKVVLTN